jgi:hypothetical protein
MMIWGAHAGHLQVIWHASRSSLKFAVAVGAATSVDMKAAPFKKDAPD